MSKISYVNPLNCNSKTFMKYYGDLKIETHKVIEYDICWYYNKNCYSYAQANQIKRAMKKSHTRTHNKISLRIYYCEFCNHYHLTSQKSHRDDLRKSRYAA